MSPCDSAVFSEGYLSTTLDRKDRKSSVTSEDVLSITFIRKGQPTSSDQKTEQPGMCM